MPLTQDHAESLALQALSFILQEDALRDRFLALTGVTGPEMQQHLSSPGFLLSVFDFLMANEPDVVACASALNEKPETLVSAWQGLGGQIME